MEIAKSVLSATGQLANGDKAQKNETQAGGKNGKLDFDAVLLSELEAGSGYVEVKNIATIGSAVTLPETFPQLPAAEVSVKDEPVLEEIQPSGAPGEGAPDSGFDDLSRVSQETMLLLERCFGSLPIQEGIQEVQDTEGRKERLVKGFLHLRKDLATLGHDETGAPAEQREAEKSAEKLETAGPDISGTALQARLLYGTFQETAVPVELGEQEEHATGLFSGSSETHVIDMENPAIGKAAGLVPTEMNETVGDAKAAARLAYAEVSGNIADAKTAARLAYMEVSGTITDTKAKAVAAEADKTLSVAYETGEPRKDISTIGKSHGLFEDVGKDGSRPEVQVVPRDNGVPVVNLRAGNNPVPLKEAEGFSGKKDEIDLVNVQTPTASSSPVPVQIDGEERASGALGEGLANFIEVVRNRKGHKGTLILDPPDLGTVRVTVESSRERVQVHLVVETTQVKTLVENSIGTLRDSMARQGLTLGETTVDVGGQGLEGGGSSGWGFGKTGDAIPLAGPGPIAEEADEEQAVARLDIERGLLHWIA